MTNPTTTTVTSPDGVRLAVHAYTDLDPQRATILAIHGYPDNHHVWDGVAGELIEQYPGRYNVVAYDVRGAGSRRRRGEVRLPLPAAGQRRRGGDRAPGRPRYRPGPLTGPRLGFDPGWAAVTAPTVAAKVGSYTSISGPHLDYAGRFLRSARNLRTLADVFRQLLESSYIWLFLTPASPRRRSAPGWVCGSWVGWTASVAPAIRSLPCPVAKTTTSTD